MFQPAGGVATARVMVCPVNYAAFRVPLVFTVERHAIPRSQSSDPGRQVDVVGHQHSLPGRESQNKSLVSRPVEVICQYPRDDALTR